MKIKTSELQGATLDWAVNQIEECCDDPFTPMFSTDWAQGGPIIERDGITVSRTDKKSDEGPWVAYRIEHLFEDEYEHEYQHGPTPLIAAMRCYVASKLGEEVEVPENLNAIDLAKVGEAGVWGEDREWVGLTDEEIDTWNFVGHETLREFVRAIEAKLKEKNT